MLTMSSPILYRTFYLLTPPSELPPLPQSLHETPPPEVSEVIPPRNPSYLSIHLYTLLQIVITVAIFILTLTRAAPAFPVLIIALVPFRLLIMKKWWRREVLRFVDAWACREGTPEDDEDAAVKNDSAAQEESTKDYVFGRGILQDQTKDHRRSDGTRTSFTARRRGSSQADLGDQRAWDTTHEDVNHEWVELGGRV